MTGTLLLLDILSGVTNEAAVSNARAALIVESPRVLAAIQFVALPTATLIEE